MLVCYYGFVQRLVAPHRFVRQDPASGPASVGRCELLRLTPRHAASIRCDHGAMRTPYLVGQREHVTGLTDLAIHLRTREQSITLRHDWPPVTSPATAP